MSSRVRKRARGLGPLEVESFSKLVLSAARLMSTDQIVVLIGALHLEVRGRREAAVDRWATLGPQLKSRRMAGRASL